MCYVRKLVTRFYNLLIQIWNESLTDRRYQECRTPPPSARQNHKPVPNPEIVFKRFFNHSSVNKTMKLHFSLISFTDTKCIMIKYKSLVVIACRGVPQLDTVSATSGSFKNNCKFISSPPPAFQFTIIFVKAVFRQKYIFQICLFIN